MLRLTKVPFCWEGEEIHEAWNNWWQQAPNDKVRTFPLLVVWGILLARNHRIFKDTFCPIARLAVEGVSLYESIPLSSNSQSISPVQVQEIKGSIPWAYFDGASDINKNCGVGLVIHFPSGNVLKASIGLGTRTNSFAELKDLHLILCWLSLRNEWEAQIFWDSLNSIKWANGMHLCRNFLLTPLLAEIIRLKICFSELKICHIYRERNIEADNLSKKGTE